MQRRTFLTTTAASALALQMEAQTPAPKAPVRIGVDVYSLQSQNFTPFQSLDYCKNLGVKVVHFSEIRFLGNLETDNLKKVKDYAGKLGIDVEIGMRSICPSSSMFDPAQGTAEEQLGKMVAAAKTIGSPIVRCVLGSASERSGALPLEGHIANTIKVLKNIRSQAMDAGVKIAIENHAGDMQARELKALIEGAGKEFVGVCIDSGNPMWTLESPHLTLETLYPYVLTSHVRDSYVWMTPDGAVAVKWVRTGEGNVGIDVYIKKYLEQCPGRAVSAEVIVQPQPRLFRVQDPKFWEPYKNTPAWEYERFLELAEKGVVPAGAVTPPTGGAGAGGGGGGRGPAGASGGRGGGGRGPVTPEVQAERLATQRTDLEVSIKYTQRLLAL